MFRKRQLFLTQTISMRGNRDQRKKGSYCRYCLSRQTRGCHVLCRLFPTVFPERKSPERRETDPISPTSRLISSLFSIYKPSLVTDYIGFSALPLVSELIKAVVLPREVTESFNYLSV
ncbi:hypothetical protein CDAR_416291 [Caerostris darwini]|uniref:Maturase K n=1 Tax=Caerostris darwini TaxID=1538125 RepID=A0AAV4W642_9ARAC|nr:hypothetical protein CDAR_416291 [Caerostris darwini]